MPTPRSTLDNTEQVNDQYSFQVNRDAVVELRKIRARLEAAKIKKQTSSDLAADVTANQSEMLNQVNADTKNNQSLLVRPNNLVGATEAKEVLRKDVGIDSDFNSLQQKEEVNKLTTTTQGKPSEPIKIDSVERQFNNFNNNDNGSDYSANNLESQKQANTNAKKISNTGLGTSVEANTPQYQVDPMSRSAYQEMLENSQSGNLFRAENVGVPQQADKKKFIAITQNKKGLAKLELVNRRTKAPLQNFQSGLFILTNTNENIAARKEIVMTQDIDVINFFGKDVFIWNYSGITLNGDVSTQDRDSTLNWYDEFTKFSMLALGQPIYQRNPHYLKFTYLNYVRYGYLLEVNYSTNSQNPALVSVNFSVAIDNFFNTETT